MLPLQTRGPGNLAPGRPGARLPDRWLLAEGLGAHGRLDATDQELLERGGAGVGGVVGEVLGIVAERGHPGPAAVVVLAPGDRMEVTVARVTHRAGRARGQGALDHGGQE